MQKTCNPYLRSRTRGSVGRCGLPCQGEATNAFVGDQRGGHDRAMDRNHPFFFFSISRCSRSYRLSPTCLPRCRRGMFLIFGIQTPASAVAMMVFNSFCSAATGVAVYEIGKEIHSEKAGLFAGWIWALSPYISILPFLPWDTCLSALLLSTALLLTLRLRSDKLTNWVVCGVTWGVAALVNPALLARLPILALLRWRHGSKFVSWPLHNHCLVPWTCGIILF